MNYRFLKLTSIYPEHVQRFLRDLPGYQDLSYDTLYKKYVETRSGWSNYFAKHLTALGNEADDLFVTLEPLQLAWAREQGVIFDRQNWLREIAIAQVRHFQPEVLFLQDLYLFDYSFRQQLRDVCRSPVTLVGFRASPTTDYSVFKDLDLVITVVPNFAERLRESGAHAAILPHGFEASVLEAAPSTASRDLDFTFIGSVILRDSFHYERYALLQHLLQSTPLEIWGNVSDPLPESRGGRIFARLSDKANRSLGTAGVSRERREDLVSLSQKFSKKVGLSPKSAQDHYGQRFHKPVYGVDNFRILGRSKLTFNNHIDCAEEYAGNMRLFEATGMGACLITDWKVNLAELFEPDVEVIAYKNAEECAEKVNYLLRNENEFRKIAEAGQKRTLRDHTLQQRVGQLDEMIRELLIRRSAGAFRSESNVAQVK